MGSLDDYVPIIFGTAFLVAMIAVIRAVRVPRDIGRRPCCGFCGYDICEPIPEKCPECGHRVVEVGLATRRLAARLRGGLFSALVGWALICLVVSNALVDALDPLFQSVSTSKWHAQGLVTYQNARSTQNSRSTSARDRYSVAIQADITGDQPALIRFGTLDVSLMDKEQVLALLRTDLRNRTVRVIDAKDTTSWSGPLSTGSAVLKLYEAAGLDPADADVVVEVTHLQEIIDQLLADPKRVHSPTTPGTPNAGLVNPFQMWSSGGWPGSGRGNYVVHGLLLLMFVLGSLWIILRRRRLLAL